MQDRIDRSLDSTAGAAERYDRATIWFHWATALLVLLIWLLAQATSFLPRGDARHNVWSAHIALGGLLLLVAAGRIFWRVRSGGTLSFRPDRYRWLAVIIHRVLYVLLVAAIVLGVANTWARGWDLFGLIQIPQYDAADTKKILAHAINRWHDIVADAIMAITALHAVAALFDHYIWRGGALKRMAPVLRLSALSIQDKLAAPAQRSGIRFGSWVARPASHVIARRPGSCRAPHLRLQPVARSPTPD